MFILTWMLVYDLGRVGPYNVQYRASSKCLVVPITPVEVRRHFSFRDSMRPPLKKFHAMCNKFRLHRTCRSTCKCGHIFGSSSIVSLAKLRPTQKTPYLCDYTQHSLLNLTMNTTDLLQQQISPHGRGVPPRRTFLV